ncbi:uncharacterized protein LOC107046348 [Diachasma alloeum]|uniref:uncharacterized protein LOC107046348 n=1 Tax=Diachasma alloeum TaxID=454923 RepID=UPI00073810D3|nr:uncharacterized protein LOC107046348 [Diachasma alloeum]
MLRNRLQVWADSEGILEESQAGFRPERSCLDQIIVLKAATQLQLRLGSRKVFSVFVDFRRAFDSIPHDKLWQKLFHLGVTSKFVKIIKSLYDSASIQVKAGGRLSDPLLVSSGVLQGESLSPLLFILYIADLEKYLRELGFRGVNINGITDVLLLLYAYDLVILVESELVLKKILIALDSYCSDLGLSVNSDKTKVMIFREGGRVSPELSSTLGFLAAKEAVIKARQASGAVFAIFARGKCDSWSSMIRLFEAITKTTLLYASPAWALNYLDHLETAQLSFVKRLLLLPKNTPSCALRLETGLLRVEYAVCKATLNYIIKILEMEDHRLPKICLRRMFELDSDPNPLKDVAKFKKFNWGTRICNFLSLVGAPELWGNFGAADWLGNREGMLERLKQFLLEQDWVDWNKCIHKIPVARNVLGSASMYLLNRGPIAYTRIKAQFRLANSHNCALRAREVVLQSRNMEPVRADQLITRFLLSESQPSEG